MTYTTTRDIIIPAGTVVHAPPTHSSRWAKDHEAVIADGADNCVYLSMDIKEALASGLLMDKVKS